tara:strand:+ start:2706 stop:3644 length:939 start_codon:yes stop_codon:yes gene_type:complete
MSKNKVLFLIIIIINFLNVGNLSANKIEILYKVENYPITNKDITKEINYLIMLNDKLKKVSEKDLIQYATKSIIKEKVKKNEIVKNLYVGQNDEVVENQLKILKNNLNLGDEEFKDLISKLDITENYLKEKIEVEILWNKLIYRIYKDKVIIDTLSISNKLKKDLEDPSNFMEEYLLHEILYTPSKTTDIENNKLKIDNSIKEIGFENTANIYSLSDSSKFGGKIGWVKENQLTKEILLNLQDLKIGEHTDQINIPGGILILFLKNKRQAKLTLSFDDELKKIINIERNRQLDKYSSIYYKKVEINTKIYDN